MGNVGHPSKDELDQALETLKRVGKRMGILGS